jgi:hypothetical protein
MTLTTSLVLSWRSVLRNAVVYGFSDCTSEGGSIGGGSSRRAKMELVDLKKELAKSGYSRLVQGWAWRAGISACLIRASHLRLLRF